MSHKVTELSVYTLTARACVKAVRKAGLKIFELTLHSDSHLPNL